MQKDGAAESSYEEGQRLPWRKSLAGSLSIAVTRLVAISLLALSLGLLWIARTGEEQAVYQLQQQRANQVASIIASYLGDALDELDLFLSLASLEDLDQVQKKYAMERFMIEKHLLISKLTLLDSEGNEQIIVSRTHSYLPEELVFVGDTDYFAEAMEGRNYVSPIYISRDNGLLSVLAVVPVTRKDGSAYGALCGEINLSLLWQQLSTIRNGETGYAYIVDNKGRFVAYQDLSMVLNRYGEDLLWIPAVELFARANGNEYGQVESYQGLIGQEVIGAYAPVQNTNWAAVVEMPESEAYAGIYSMYYYSGFLIVVGVLASIWIATFISRRFARPIYTLADTARRLGEGDMEVLVQGSERMDELGVLACAFNKMHVRLRALILAQEKKVEELRNAREEQNELIIELENRNTELVNLREMLKNIIDSMPSLLVGVDRDGRITQWNAQASRQTAVQEADAMGKLLKDVLPIMEKRMPHIEKAIADRNIFREDKVISDKPGDNRLYELMVYPLTADSLEGAVVRVDDITEKVFLEEMMIQTEKMMSVGGLAAGMAHEINNPLGGVLQGAQNIERRLALDSEKNRECARRCGVELEKVREYLDKRQIMAFLEGIKQSGVRASKIVTNMLLFSRSSESIHELHNLNQLLDRSIELASSDYDLKKKYDFRYINIIRDYDADLPPVVCSETEIEQVILNIVKNSAQAMTGMAEQNENPALCVRTRMEEGMSVIEIEDNGPGMSEAVKRRIFEPFYTTKPLGVGTGLGLSVSYFIVTKNHGGQIYVESSPGQGTRFIIKLPAAASTENPPEDPGSMA